MNPLTILAIFCVLATPIILASWFWAHDSNEGSSPKWRSGAFFLGLIAGSLSVLVHCALGAYPADPSRSGNFYHDVPDIGFLLSLVAFIGAAIGDRGQAGIALSVNAALGLILSIPIGIL